MILRTSAVAAAALAGLLTIGTAAAQARLWGEPGPCDRDCLIGVARTYLDALVAQRPSAAPLAEGLRFIENAEPKRAGDGLWQTATAAPDDFAIYVPDPVAQQIGFIGMMEESGQPIQLGLRLKLEDGKITEAEHLVVRSFNGNALDNLQTPRPGLLATLPERERLPRELMLAIGMTYYDAIEQSDGEATLFAAECERRENGMITAGGQGLGFDGQPRQGCTAQLTSRAMSYIDSIDLRRVWIADEVTGLVFGLSHFRHSMTNNEITVIGPNGERTQRPMSFDPFDLPAAHIFKIRDGRMYEIEALGFMMPYLSKNGWSDFLR